jgi:carboxymethylenebutenolidase
MKAAAMLDVLPDVHWTRRKFVAVSVATGFTAMAGPVRAEAIRTPDDGLVAGEVKLPAQGGELPAYRARPAGDGPFPTVLVVQEVFGVHEHIKDICRRFAKLGYLAIAPELYARQGDPSKVTSREQLFAIVLAVPDVQVMADLDAAVAWAEADGHADTARVGITGFCWGGRIVWLYAAHNAKLSAGAAWYGRLVKPETASALQPKYPLDVAAELAAPVLGLYGGKDDGIPVDHVEQMRAALEKAGKKSEIVLYPEAPHAFYADYRPSYREDAAQDGWQRLQAWFKANGV